MYWRKSQTIAFLSDDALLYYHNAIDMLLQTVKLNFKCYVWDKELLTITKIYVTIINIGIFIISVAIVIIIVTLSLFLLLLLSSLVSLSHSLFAHAFFTYLFFFHKITWAIEQIMTCSESKRLKSKREGAIEMKQWPNIFK